MTGKHRIAVIEGDGVGREVVPQARRAVEASTTEVGDAVVAAI
jgi:isocitrate/isopropylmalate dehydrogenase